jgi:ABC-2 type transport system permease protein
MADDSQNPSFSPGRRFKIGFGVTVATIAVLACVVMVNYLSGQIFHRFYLSSKTRVELSSRTKSLVRGLTNQIQVTVYFSKNPDDEFYRDVYPDVASLLKEYTSENPKITVRYIDYERDPGLAEEFKIKYASLGVTTNKNLIAFDCEGRAKIVRGDLLVEKTFVNESENPGQLALRKKPVRFFGEIAFTGALLAVTNPKPLKAYVLQGHGEHDPASTEESSGYSKFTEALRQNYVEVDKLTLLGTNGVPADCSLLIIPGPEDPIFPIELNRIEKYLNQGGRVFVLFSYSAVRRNVTTGLEKILESWGVKVTSGVVKDPDYTSTDKQMDVIAACGVKLPDDIRIRHPVINSLVGSRLQLILPREIDALDTSSQPDSGLKAQEILFSGPNSFLESPTGAASPRSAKPLIVAVERSGAKGVAAENGATRILVTGDSIFLGNRCIDLAANRDFVANAANWLLERPLLLEGVQPKPITEYSLTISKVQLQNVRWILLAAIPGGILLLGGGVWMRRRK